ncbi:MAG: cellulose biosynthesis protein BcsD [Succinivibrio sp.]
MSGYFSESNNASTGFKDTIFILMRMMSENGSRNDVCDFLYEAGCNLASLYKVRTTDSLSKLNIEINNLLDSMGFGVASIEDRKDRLTIIHRQLPKCSVKNFEAEFAEYLSVLLCGLYQSWFKQTGAPSALKCTIASNSTEEAVFVLAKAK